MDFCGSERTLLAGKSAVEIPSANSAQNGFFDGLFLIHSACSVPIASLRSIPVSEKIPFRNAPRRSRGTNEAALHVPGPCERTSHGERRVGERAERTRSR